MTRFKVIQSGKEVEVYKFENDFFDDFTDLFRSSYTRPDEQKTSEEKFRSSRSRTKNRLRRLISSNVGKWGQPPILVTYTFAENLKDLPTANHYFRNYTQRVNRALGFKLKYLSVPEFQKRGAVHYHVIYFNLPFLKDITYLEKIWGHGSTKVEAVRKPKAMGVYLAKYLQKSFGDVRLLGKKCYTASQGLNKPIEKKVDNLLDLDLDFDTMRLKKDVTYQVGSFGSVNYKRFN